MTMVQKNLLKVLKTKRRIFVIPIVVKQNQLRPLWITQPTYRANLTERESRSEISILNRKNTLRNLQFKRLCNLHLAQELKRNPNSYTVSCSSNYGIFTCFLCSPS